MSTAAAPERAGLGRLFGRVNSLRDVGRRRISITPRESASPPDPQPRASSVQAASEALSAPLTPKGESLGENSGQREPLSQRLLSRIHRRAERSASTGTHSVRRAQAEPGKSVRRAQSLMPLLPGDGKSSGRGSLGGGASRGKGGSASTSGASDPAAAASTKARVSFSLDEQPPSPRPAAMEVQRSRHRTKRRPGASEVVEVQVEVCNVPASRLDTPPPKTPPPRAASRQPTHHSSPSVVVGIPLAEAEYGSPAFVLGAHPYGSGHYAALPGAGRYGPSPLADSKDGLSGKAPTRFKCGSSGREAGAGKPSAFAAMLEFDNVQVEEEDMAAEEAAAVEEAILSSLQTAAIEGSADTERARPAAAASSAADGENHGQRSGRGDGKPRRLWSAEEEDQYGDQYGWPSSPPPRPPPRSAAAPLLSPQRSDGARPRRSATAPPGVTVLWNPDAATEGGGGGGEGSVAAVAAGDEGKSIPHHPSFPRVGDDQIDFLIAKFDTQGGDGTSSSSGRRRRRKKKSGSTASGSAVSSATPSLLHEEAPGGEGGPADTLDAGAGTGAGTSAGAGGSSGAGSGSSSRHGSDAGGATSRVASFGAVPDAGAAFGVTLRSALSPRRPSLVTSDDAAPPEPPPRNGLPPEPPPRGVGNGAERRKEELRKSVKFALDGQAPAVRLPQQSSAADANSAALGARVGAEALEKVQKQLSAQRKLIAKQADAISSLVAERAAAPGNSLDSLTEDSLTLARPSAPRAAATISSSLEVHPPRRRGVRGHEAIISPAASSSAASVAELQEAELQAKRWPTWETSPRRLDVELSQIAIPGPETETDAEPPEPPPRDRLAELREPPEPPRRRRRKKKSHGGSTVGSSSIVSSDCSVSSSPDSVSSSVLLSV